ncbi:MAG TPA: MBL fold metallo-hydrolase [Acidimicrobiales bacterium]|nr:MBL fold metallo-hydrolase [Acidimicrobiales bacterium]
MRVWICGARGSTPAVGADFNHVGGHTSCVAIGQGDGPPTLVLDAGTGLRNLTGVLAGAPFRGTILLSHLHWDHTHGLPFFAAGDRPDASTHLYLPEQGVEPGELLARTMSPPHFPIGPHQLRGEWTFGVIDRGAYRFEGFDVLVREIPHKGGKTLGFRVSDGARSLAYLSDHAPQDRGAGRRGVGALHDDALDLARDVDVLVHDAQYTAEELPTRGSFGHAAYEYSLELAAAAGARRVLLFHHDPSRTDPEVEAILHAARRRAAAPASGGDVAVDLARDGITFTIGNREQGDTSRY